MRSGERIGTTFKPEVQVLAERAGLDHLFEVAVRRGDDAAVGAHALLAADARELAGLQHAQHLRLRGQRHVADLVEEDRAAIGDLEQAALLRDRAGERTALVTEQLALDQLGRESPRS